MLLNENDIDFLCAQTKLTDIKLISLLESDEDLILQVLSENPTHDSILTISFPLFVKMSILKETKDQNKFSSESKDYVTNTVTSVYPKVHKLSPYLIDKKRIGETEAQYYLVLVGLFPEYMQRLKDRGAPAPDFYISVAKKGFQYSHREEIADTIHDWIRVLNNIRKKLWK